MITRSSTRRPEPKTENPFYGSGRKSAIARKETFWGKHVTAIYQRIFGKNNMRDRRPVTFLIKWTWTNKVKGW